MNETSFIDNEVQDVNIDALNSSNTIIEYFKSYGNEDIQNKNNDWENYFDNINHLILKPNDTFPFHIKDLVDKKNNIITKKIARTRNVVLTIRQANFWTPVAR